MGSYFSSFYSQNQDDLDIDDMVEIVITHHCTYCGKPGAQNYDELALAYYHDDCINSNIPV